MTLTLVRDELEAIHNGFDDLAFSDLQSAEKFLFESLDVEAKSKLDQVITILYIKRHQLFKQKKNPDTGEPFEYFEDWLKSIEGDLELKGVGKASSIKQWIANYRVFCEQLGYPHQWLLEMGSHAKELMPAANVSKFNSDLEDEEKTLPNGGRKLGRNEFKDLADEIHGRVLDKDPNVPELNWQVRDTRNVVREYLGQDDPVTWFWKVTQAGDAVNINEFGVFIGKEGIGHMYTFYSKAPVPLEHFNKFAKGKIEGLE